MSSQSGKLGLAVLAALVLGAVWASSAMAVEYFHSHVGKVNPDSMIIEGEGQNHVFRLIKGGPAVTCKFAKLGGTEEVKAGGMETHTGGIFGTTLTAKEITVTPIYEACESPGGITSVTTAKCHYRFEMETSNEHGRAHIECIEGASIEIAVGSCKVKIGSQTPEGGVNYSNNKAGATNEWDINAKATISRISYKSEGLACGLLGIPSEGSEGTYEGETTVKGYEDNEKSLETGVYHKGSQLGIWRGPTE